MSHLGKVSIVGAGPGSLDLLTLRAYRVLVRAEVVLYDQLVGEDIIGLASGAERICVGKVGGGQSTSQDEIHNALWRYARDGKHVVRLKGGDPFVFGRGGEEAIFLRERGIDVEIIPGVSSATSVPASVGIPVTHRNVSTSFSVVTAMGATDSGSSLRDAWIQLARAGGTVVFLMGLAKISDIVEAMLDGGRTAETPAAVISAGTTPDERVVVGDLSNIARLARESELASPAMVVIGPVVHLRDQILGLARAAEKTNQSALSLQWCIEAGSTDKSGSAETALG